MMGRNRQTIGDVLAATPDLTWDDMRHRIAERADTYEMTSIGFDTCGAYYNQDMNEWILISCNPAGDNGSWPNKASYWGDLPDILLQVPDDEIQHWYEEYTQEDYDDE